MANVENIKEKLVDYVSKSVAGGKILSNDNLFELGLVHSLFAMQLILYIEKEFDVELEDDDLDFEKISTIEEISQMVERRLAS